MKSVNKLWSIIIAIMMITVLSPELSFANNGLGGNGTEASPYEISSEEDLIQMVDKVKNGEGDAFYVMTTDFEVTSESIEPIGKDANTAFTGSFDGQGHKITGYKQRLTADDGNYGGLFGYTNNATIKNITMESVNINNTGSKAYVGGIVGYMKNGTIENVKVTSGSVSSGMTAGGIIGGLENGATFRSFENEATVSGSSCAGGILGYTPSSVTLSRMKNSGNINGRTAGGVLGTGYNTYTKIENSRNSGTITGTSYAGGICGERAAITDCENTGSIKGDRIAGILSYSGAASGTVAKSSNKGTVSGTGEVAGICIGGSSSECYNTAAVTSTGGMAYGIGPSATNCYNTGKITSTSTAMGIGMGATTSYNIGVVNGQGGSYAISNKSVANCYYLGNRGTGVSGATSLTSEQMEIQESFTGFNFGTWTLAGIEEYPYPELNAVEMVYIESVIEGFAGGKGTAKDPYHVQTARILGL